MCHRKTFPVAVYLDIDIIDIEIGEESSGASHVEDGGIFREEFTFVVFAGIAAAGACFTGDELAVPVDWLAAGVEE